MLVRVMGVLLLMYSRYKGSCTLQRCLLQAPTSCCSRIWFKRGLSRLNIVFSESRDMAGLRFLGRQLSVKTSLLIVTGPAQCLVNTGACRVIRGEWGRVRQSEAEWAEGERNKPPASACWWCHRQTLEFMSPEEWVWYLALRDWSMITVECEWYVEINVRWCWRWNVKR